MVFLKWWFLLAVFSIGIALPPNSASVHTRIFNTVNRMSLSKPRLFLFTDTPIDFLSHSEEKLKSLHRPVKILHNLHFTLAPAPLPDLSPFQPHRPPYCFSASGPLHLLFSLLGTLFPPDIFMYGSLYSLHFLTESLPHQPIQNFTCLHHYQHQPLVSLLFVFLALFTCEDV